LRLPATRYLSASYAIAFGGLVALGLYLPVYLRQVYHLGANLAVLSTAACLTVAAATRPLGGWLCQRHDPVALLRICFAGSAIMCLLLAFDPPFTSAAIPAVFGAALCLGVAGGVVQ